MTADKPLGDEPTEALNKPTGPKPPSLVPGVTLLGLAAILMIVVLVKPDMPSWLKTTIAILAILVVLVLLAYAFRLFLSIQRGGRR